jgi:hypothetical protein
MEPLIGLPEAFRVVCTAAAAAVLCGADRKPESLKDR